MSIKKFRNINPIPSPILSDAKFSKMNNNNVFLNVLKGKYTTWKLPVKVATTQHIDLFEEQVIDGVQVYYGDRVLVKNQITSENGIYLVNKSWKRSDDLPEGSVAVGVTIFVAQGIANANTYFFCTNNFNDLVGSATLVFQPIRGITNGAIDSIQVNNPNGSFSGSSAFTYEEGDTTRTLTIGNKGLDTYIKNTYGYGIFPFSTTDNTVSNGCNIQIITGKRGDNVEKIFLYDDGPLTISSNNSTTTYTGDVIFTANNEITLQSAGDITITTGSIEDPSFNVNKNYMNFTATQGVVNLTQGSKITTIKEGSLTFTKDTATIATVGVSPTLNSRNAFIQITTVNLAAGTSTNLVILNNTIKTTDMIFSEISVYTGTGVPVIYPVTRSHGTSFALKIANVGAAPLSGTLTISFIIF